MKSDAWFYEYEGRKVGPIPLETLRHLVRHGVIHRQSRVWEGEASEPDVAETVDGLFEPLKAFAPRLLESPSDEGVSLDLEDAVVLPSEPPSDFAIQVADNFALSPSDLDGSKSTPAPRGVALPLGARPYEHLYDYSWARLICQKCEGPIQQIMEQGDGEQLPPAPPKAQLEQDILFLASAMTQGENGTYGLPIRSVQQVWGAFQGEPDTFMIRLVGIDPVTDVPSRTNNSVSDGLDWSVSLDEPCMSVRYLSEYDRQQGTSLAQEFILLASQICDVLDSHWGLSSSRNERRKQRLLEWLKDSCKDV